MKKDFVYKVVAYIYSKPTYTFPSLKRWRYSEKSIVIRGLSSDNDAFFRSPQLLFFKVLQHVRAMPDSIAFRLIVVNL